MKIFKFVFILVGLLALQKQVIAQTKDVYDFCRNGDTTALRKMLTVEPTLVNDKKSNGFTPFIIATYNGQLEISKILIEKGANINAQDKSGNTALMGLCFNGNINLVKLLISHKVDVNVLNYVNNGFNLKKVQLGLGCPLQFHSN